MKKRPETSTRESDPDLVGSNEESTWIIGRNCVYRDSTVAEYRVSIRTDQGWKSYGHFHDQETAAYVANIAILVEGCEERYELNKEIGVKDRDELTKWRNLSGHVSLERKAAERYKQVQVELEALREQKHLKAVRDAVELNQREAELAERKQQEKAVTAEKRRILDEKVKTIYGLSNSELVNFIKSTNVDDPLYEIAMNDAVRRYKKLGLPRAT